MTPITALAIAGARRSLAVRITRPGNGFGVEILLADGDGGYRPKLWSNDSYEDRATALGVIRDHLEAAVRHGRIVPYDLSTEDVERILGELQTQDVVETATLFAQPAAA